MKHLYLKIAILVVLAAVVGLYVYAFRSTAAQPQTQPVQITKESSQESESVAEHQKTTHYVEPMTDAAKRITKKPFGIHITRENSPVSPERFSGYHVGTDFETTPEETDVDIPIYAICNGPLLQKRYVNGYGGLAIQRCTIDQELVTVLYGHLRLTSILATTGEEFQAGEQIAMLGTGFSPETDGERKHLHLGIHKGTAIDLRGYAQSSSELVQWIDPMTLFSK